MKLSALAITVTAAVTVLLGFTAPALATNGRTAVGLCIDRGAACTHKVAKDGGTTIEVDGHYIFCPSATAECEIIYKTGQTGPRPTVNSLLSKSNESSFGGAHTTPSAKSVPPPP